jgi:hypothetical protein
MTDLETRLPGPPEPSPSPRRPRLFHAARLCLRSVATLHALLAMGQALSIGQYLDGGFRLLRLHATGAGVLVLTGMTLGVAAVLYVVAGGRIWVAAVCVPFYLAEGVQTGLGYSRSLAVHVPLGVAIIAGALVVCGWSWTRAAARPRIRR